MMKRSIVIGLLALAWSCSSPQEQEKIKNKPNIIYIMADDLGYGDLGCYGAEKIATPHLDQMAAEGMIFTDHYSGAPVCAPARAILMTGKHSGNAYIRGNAQWDPSGQIPLPVDEITVAEKLKEAGYITGMVGKWGLGIAQTVGEPSKQGFDYYYGYLDQVLAHNYYPEYLIENGNKRKLNNEVKYLDSAEWHKGLGSYATEKVEYSHDLFTAKSLDFIERNQDSSFFLYIPYTIPHDNGEAPVDEKYEVPEIGQYEDRNWNPEAKGYAAMITRLDADIKRILDKLKELNIDKNTLVIFTSDNGPTKAENIREVFDTNGPLRGYKRDIYEGGIRVPHIAWWPGSVAEGTRSEHPSAFWDFMATACDIAGIASPEESNGISYLPSLLGKEQPKHEYLYWEFSAGWLKIHQQAVRQGPWKLVRILQTEVNQEPVVELYNLEEDPGEENNLASEFPERVSKMIMVANEATQKPVFEGWTDYTTVMN